ncbi:hypothetical protein Rhe02_49720 [Rhizocola hellebori]|uniref:Uncharacterized protein n=1 Tax=Rhizocola hellebori TaxID=1392758 RepID=A0A8J3QC70_9ACTN|nr:hypothetical protein [Rhizocola hellebori]GIH06905.1 hypothetical protein Rhe02_49720 [Rhizocola hellebori]
MVIGSSDAPDLPPGVDLMALVRRFEPVLHFTEGEMFFPMRVDDYLRRAALWSFSSADDPATLLVDHGSLDSEALAAAALAHPDWPLFLRYAPRSLQRRELRAWRRRADRPRFTGVSRLAAVGMLGRIIDSGMRLSLTLRGKVPGGLTAAAQQQYALTTPVRDAYHAHVSTDGGYVIIQYWFLYAMNDWRSSFSGVNDHESDWEQVTIYLVPARGEPAQTAQDLQVGWVAFSAHDEVGDDLRRRADDPDLGWVEGTHPVVNVGAGSHSGAYLAGDYLVRIQPPALARIFSAVSRVRALVFPWTRNRPSLGVGIPYVDYRRGDGTRIGPGSRRPWTAILIDSQTPWVRDFRGLWGLDTADPFGGERAPAGPRYERAGLVRASWADPVAWAGLDKVPATPAAQAMANAARVAELDGIIAELNEQIAESQTELRGTAAGMEVLPPAMTAARRGRDSAGTRLASQEQAIAGLRERRREAASERDQLSQVRHDTLTRPPHAHLRHRATPDTTMSTGALLRFWSGASLSVLLALLGLALLFERGSLLMTCALAVVVVTAVEAILRGRMLVFLLGLAIIAGALTLTWLFLTHLRVAAGLLALVAAVSIGVANLRTLARR